MEGPLEIDGRARNDGLDAQARARYANCQVCPRECGVDRLAGQRGACGETSVCRIGSICPHFGEEPSISGCNGSGTVFLAGCSSRCFFCQNYRISREGQGRIVSMPELQSAVEDLVRTGVHNINLVTPEHFWPHVLHLCRRLRACGCTVPFVFNSSGYLTDGLVKEAVDCMQVFLPDFKFSDPLLARECMGDARYPALAMGALRQMVRRAGFLSPWAPSGGQTALGGVLVRHLVLPGHVKNSLGVLRRLYAEFGTGLPLSIMSQYHPTPECRRRGALDRRLTAAEYNRVVREAEDLGFEKVYIQMDSGDSVFLPDFDAPHAFPER